MSDLHRHVWRIRQNLRQEKVCLSRAIGPAVINIRVQVDSDGHPMTVSCRKNLLERTHMFRIIQIDVRVAKVEL